VISMTGKKNKEEVETETIDGYERYRIGSDWIRQKHNTGKKNRTEGTEKGQKHEAGRKKNMPYMYLAKYVC